MELLFGIPGLCLALLFSYVKRRNEINAQPFTIDELLTVAVLSGLGTAILIYLLLSGNLLSVRNLGALIVATVVVWVGIVNSGFGLWLMKKFIKEKREPTT